MYYNGYRRGKCILPVNKMSSTCQKVSRHGLKNQFFFYYIFHFYYFSPTHIKCLLKHLNLTPICVVMCHNLIHFMVIYSNFCAQINLYWTCQVLFDVVVGWWYHTHTHMPTLVESHGQFFFISFIFIWSFNFISTHSFQ